ncbi:MAG: (Fe-S)-binding protein [Proteobacteria bacterium]|nr:(Fe-S)-binding protein [Pseudomonadota bacterium]
MATRSGLQKWYPEFFDQYGVFTVFDLLVDYLKSGRIQVDKSINSVRAAYHDPCNYGRKSMDAFGKAYYEEPRWIMDQCMSDWVDLFPKEGNQYCCGGGGGTLLTPYKEERVHYARKKMEQIKRAGVELMVIPCHSCHGQIKAMVEIYDMPDLQVKYLWEVVADALVVS